MTTCNYCLLPWRSLSRPHSILRFRIVERPFSLFSDRSAVEIVCKVVNNSGVLALPVGVVHVWLTSKSCTVITRFGIKFWPKAAAAKPSSNVGAPPCLRVGRSPSLFATLLSESGASAWPKWFGAEVFFPNRVISQWVIPDGRALRRQSQKRRT